MTEYRAAVVHDETQRPTIRLVDWFSERWACGQHSSHVASLHIHAVSFRACSHVAETFPVPAEDASHVATTIAMFHAALQASPDDPDLHEGEHRVTLPRATLALRVADT